MNMEARRINNETVIDKATVYRRIWTFRTQEQMDLFINEMQGQISDGLFENSVHTDWLYSGNDIFRLGEKTELVYQGFQQYKKLTYPITNEFIDNVAYRIYTENGFEYGDRKSLRAAWKEITDAIKNWRGMTAEEYSTYIAKPLELKKKRNYEEKLALVNVLRDSKYIDWQDDDKTEYKSYGHITIDEKKLFFSFCVTDYEKQTLNVCVNYNYGRELREFKFFVKASEFDNKLTQVVKFILNF